MKKSKFSTLNDDGVSVAGCSYIYAPRGQAGEYSPLAANPYRGCGHKCAYCYVPGITEQDMLSFPSDVYNPVDMSLTRPSLEIIQQHGLGICTLTKGGTRALA